MIISDNSKSEKIRFQSLISRMDKLLNDDAAAHEDYYVNRGGKLLEQDVFGAIQECAKGTEFQGTIQLVSGASFPDIVANNYFGIEVKSTEKDHWTSIGSSILESTRSQDVEKIYLTFGKLGKPVQFISRPYEECLSGIAVTHYPRYQIDMKLHSGETIFDKMGVSYDDLRSMDNPVAPVSKYYKSKLKPGESLWWANDDAETVAPPTVKLWTALSQEVKEQCAIQGYVLFPEILSNSSTKYNKYALWLATQKGIVNTNIRDSFSAGGQIPMPLSSGVFVKMPAAFGRIKKYRYEIIKTIDNMDEDILKTYWGVQSIAQNKLHQWIQLVATSANTTVGYGVAYDVLHKIFDNR